MPDSEFDDSLIAVAVAEYQDATMPYIKPAGTAAALATATHRRRVRSTAIAAIAAIAMVGTGTAYAALSRDGNAPPPDVGASVSASPASSASPTPSATAAPSGSADPDAGANAGRQGPNDLSHATLNLPAPHSSGCPHGPTKFSGGRAGQYTTIEKVLSADVDRDGAADDVALIDCRRNELRERAVVAFHRHADGTFSTIGLVAQIGTGDIKNLLDVDVAGTEVTVKVGDDTSTSTDGWGAAGVVQWRTYGWHGSRFVQTGGSTSFLADTSANHLSATASALVFAKPSGGVRHGTMTETVRNTGKHEVRQVVLVMVSGDSPGLSSAACTRTGSWVLSCQLGTLDPGASKTLTFGSSISAQDADNDIANGGLDLSEWASQLRIGDRKYNQTMGLTAKFD
jgi:hypothetical protein